MFLCCFVFDFSEAHIEYIIEAFNFHLLMFIAVF